MHSISIYSKLDMHNFNMEILLNVLNIRFMNFKYHEMDIFFNSIDRSYGSQYLRSNIDDNKINFVIYLREQFFEITFKNL